MTVKFAMDWAGCGRGTLDDIGLYSGFGMILLFGYILKPRFPQPQDAAGLAQQPPLSTDTMASNVKAVQTFGKKKVCKKPVLRLVAVELNDALLDRDRGRPCQGGPRPHPH